MTVITAWIRRVFFAAPKRVDPKSCWAPVTLQNKTGLLNTATESSIIFGLFLSSKMFFIRLKEGKQAVKFQAERLSLRHERWGNARGSVGVASR